MRRQQTKLLAAVEYRGARTQGTTAKRTAERHAWRNLRARLNQDKGAERGVAAEEFCEGGRESRRLNRQGRQCVRLHGQVGRRSREKAHEYDGTAWPDHHRRRRWAERAQGQSAARQAWRSLR